MNDPGREKPDWRSIEGGIRGGALGTVLSGLLGGCIQSTSTINIGIAGASGITMLRNMFDNVRLNIDDGAMILHVDADV